MEKKEGRKYVTCLCEGPNDALLLQRMKPFFHFHGLFLRIKIQTGIDRLVRNGTRLVLKYHGRGPVLLFYDEADLKKGYIQKLDSAAESSPSAMAVPVVRKIEAWLMADTEAFFNATGIRYPGPLPTDSIEDPKRLFLHYFRVAVRQGKRGFLSRESDFFRSMVWRWDMERARKNNISLQGFYSLFVGKVSEEWNI